MLYKFKKRTTNAILVFLILSMLCITHNQFLNMVEKGHIWLAARCNRIVAFFYLHLLILDCNL